MKLGNSHGILSTAQKWVNDDGFACRSVGGLKVRTPCPALELLYSSHRNDFEYVNITTGSDFGCGGNKKMLMELDVVEGANSPLSVNRFFDLLDEPRPVNQVFAADPEGNDLWCRVTGWSSTGPCQAMAALSEDSGDGVVLLIYGGDEGIRLSPLDATEDWDLANTNQWGEACLMLDKSAPARE